MSFGPSFVIISPAKRTPEHGVPLRAISRAVGRMMRSITSRSMSGREYRRWRIRPHPAGVRARVAVPDPLVVLRRGEGQHLLAVDEGEEARLLPPMNSSTTTVASLPNWPANMSSMAASASARVMATTTPLPAASPSYFHHDRRSVLRRMRLRRRRVREAAVGGGRHTRRVAYLLGEGLGALQPRRGRPVAEHLEACGPEIVASPATSGASGPTTTKPIFISAQKRRRRRGSVASSRTFSPQTAVPGLPGAMKSLVRSGLAERAAASACSRPPSR